MNRQHFDRFELIYIFTFWLSKGLLNAWINAESVIADFHRLSITIENWEPYCWELTSHFMVLCLIPAIVLFNRRYPLNSNNILGSIIAHLAFSFIYSVIHIVGMVLLRNAIYSFVGGSYDFGDWTTEFIYEYRKDIHSYIWILIIIYSYGFIISRLRGEAKVIATGEDNVIPEKPERLLVKKIGKEFILKIDDIDWIEAAGNYMNLHVKSRIYPLRETMSNLEKKLNANQFVRIHRSTIVNLDRIKEIQPLDTGDFDMILNNDKKLKLSRRYREKIQDVLF
ncbi:MAG: LytR/AlgR family response regulator transcription factor [Kangiellaceae bacterium]